MFGRERFLKIYGFDYLRWAKRFGLEIFTVPCSNCDAPRETTIPFFYGDFRGLIAPLCKCGTDDAPYCIINKNGGDLDSLFPPKGRKPR